MKTAEIKLPFGLKGDTLLHISEAQPGLACECVCPSCMEPLIARKGTVTTHHFAHRTNTQCEHAIETALHLASKRLLSARREIKLPAVYIQFQSNREPFLIAPENIYSLDKVREEQRADDIVPDLLAVIRNTPLMIEIRVTHAVDDAKLRKIRSLGISAIEIDLSSVSRDLSPNALGDALINQTANKKWLYNARAEDYKQRLFQAGEHKKIIKRGFALHVDNCPIAARTWRGKSYANLMDDCASCDFCLHVADNNSLIICGGRRKIATFEQLRTLPKHTPLDRKH